MVLCVEEEPVVLATRKLVLQSAGFTVVTAADPRDALRLLSAEKVDAVVLDSCLAELEGATIAIMMKQLKPQVPIVMLTPQELQHDGTREGIDAFVPKGNGPQAMLDTLQSLLR